jgi:hypothetical protein
MVHSSDKLTSYTRRWGQPYTSLASFGEAVNFKISASRTPKLASSWSTGVWLGKDSLTNDHLVATADGIVIRARTVRRLPSTSQWQPGLVTAIKGTPSSPDGSGALDENFILGTDSLSFQNLEASSRSASSAPAQGPSSSATDSAPDASQANVMPNGHDIQLDQDNDTQMDMGMEVSQVKVLEANVFSVTLRKSITEVQVVVNEDASEVPQPLGDPVLTHQ